MTQLCAGDTDCTFIYFMKLSRSCLAVSHRLSIHLCTGARMWLEVGETEDSIVWWTQRIRMWLEVGETDDIMVDAMYQEQQRGGGTV